MANTVTLLNYANTFGDWVLTTNALAQENNDIAANNYTKPTGTLYLSDPTLGLQVAKDAIIAGQLQVVGLGSSAQIGNALTVGQVFISNTATSMMAAGNVIIGGTANVNSAMYMKGTGTGLTVSNSVSIGANVVIGGVATVGGMSVSNDAVILSNVAVGKNVTANNLYANNNAFLGDSLSVYNNAYVKNLSANVSIYAPAIVATDATISSGVITNNVQANTNVNTPRVTATNATISSGVITNNVQANTNVNTPLVTATNATISSGVITNNVQANTNVNTPLVTATNATISSGVITNNVQANTNVNTPALTANNANIRFGIIANSIQSNTSINTSSLTANTIQVYESLNVNGKLDANGSSTSYFNNIFASGQVAVGGNFVINGSTIYNSNTLTISADVLSAISAYINVNRGMTGANASIRWNESSKYWDIRDVDNPANTYSKILTANLISDSVTTVSSSTMASSTAANTLNNSIIAVNTALNNANTFLQANTGSALAASKVYTDSAAAGANSVITTANTSMKSYVDTANTSMKSYVDTANTSMKSYVDTANTSMKSYVDTANTNLKAYVDNKSTFTPAATFSSDVTVTGNLFVNGSTTTVNTSTVTTNDSLIKLAANNIVDTLDIGFYGQYGSSGTKYAGLFRKAADKFYLVKDLATDPTGNTITFTAANRATIDANLTGGVVSSLSAAIGIADGGTNNTTYSTGQRVIYDGSKIASQSNTSTTVTGSLSADKTITSFSVNAYGEVTAYTGAAIAIASSAVSGLASSATTDTTNAANITSGLLPDARLNGVGTAGTYGSPSYHPVITTDAKGRVSGVTNTAIAIPGTAVTSIVASATTATNLSGGAANQIPYQTATGATSFVGTPMEGQVLGYTASGGIAWVSGSSNALHGVYVDNDGNLIYDILNAASAPTTVINNYAMNFYAPNTSILSVSAGQLQTLVY